MKKSIVGIFALGLLLYTSSTPSISQGGWSPFAEGFFPGEVRFEVSGYLDNEGIGSDRAIGLGRNGESAPTSPLSSFDMHNYEWDSFPGFRFAINPTVRDPKNPESLFWLNIIFDAVNLEGQPARSYPVTEYKDADYSSNLPQVILYDVIDQRWGEYYRLIEGSAYIESNVEGDVYATRFVIDLMVQSTTHEEVEPLRIRATAYTYTLSAYRYTDLSLGEHVLNLQGELAATDADQMTIQVDSEAGDEAQERFILQFDASGFARNNPELQVPIQFEITGEARPPLCDPNDWLVRDGFHNQSGQFWVDGSVFTPEMKQPDEHFDTAVAICYEDENRTMLSGVLGIPPIFNEWADRFHGLDLTLLFRGIPVMHLP